MGDSGKVMTVRSENLRDIKHVRKSVLLTLGDVEILSRHLAPDNRRKGTEAFPFLNQAVDSISHPGIAWVRQDASAPECARSKLHAALKPGDDLPRRKAA